MYDKDLVVLGLVVKERERVLIVYDFGLKFL